MREAFTEHSGFAKSLVEPPAPLVAAPLAGPHTDARTAAGLDLILEGFLLHHGTARHLDIDDEGRRVLAGDYCYAQGLVWVSETGDLEVIALLADLVAMSSALVATGDRAGLGPLWRATIAAIADRDAGFAERLSAAKTLLRTRSDSSGLHSLTTDLQPAPALQEALDA